MINHHSKFRTLMFRLQRSWFTFSAKLRVWRWSCAENFSKEYRAYTSLVGAIDRRLHDNLYLVVAAIGNFRRAGFTAKEIAVWFNEGEADFAENVVRKISDARISHYIDTQQEIFSSSLITFKKETFTRCITAMALGMNRNDIIPVVLLSLQTPSFTNDSTDHDDSESEFLLVYKAYQKFPATSISEWLDTISIEEILRYADADVDASIVDSTLDINR